MTIGKVPAYPFSTALPQINGPLNVGSLWEYRVEYSGPSRADITVDNLPAWLDFNGFDFIQGTPQSSDIGVTDTIRITVENTTHEDMQTFEIEVR